VECCLKYSVNHSSDVRFRGQLKIEVKIDSHYALLITIFLHYYASVA